MPVFRRKSDGTLIRPAVSVDYSATNFLSTPEFAAYLGNVAYARVAKVTANVDCASSGAYLDNGTTASFAPGGKMTAGGSYYLDISEARRLGACVSVVEE